MKSEVGVGTEFVITLPVSDPYGEGWVARIQPLDAADDLARLTQAD